MKTQHAYDPFQGFDLLRLMQTVLAPKPCESVALLIDLRHPEAEMSDYTFLSANDYEVQKRAYSYFYLPLRESILRDMQLTGGDLFAYQMTFGNELDLPSDCFDVNGNRRNLANDVYKRFNIVICISRYSAEAPLTTAAKEYGFRGASLYGVNDTILQTGLVVDYEQANRTTERIRHALARPDAAEIDFVIAGRKAQLQITLDGQIAQRSHGVAWTTKEVVNLPTGEIYYLSKTAQGSLPLKFKDGTLALMRVEDGHLVTGQLVSGRKETFAHYLEKLQVDPAAGEFAELGFGTQSFPFADEESQDEKVLGTFHIATGRSDYLGGAISPADFHIPSNAAHDNMLFSEQRTPEVRVPAVRMVWGQSSEILLSDYRPAKYLRGLLP